MNRLFILLIAIVALVSCSKEQLPVSNTTFDVLITQQPVGGLNVATVSTTFMGLMTGTVNPVTVTSEWFVESQYHENAFVISSSLITFNEGTTITKSTSCQVLDPYRYSVYYWNRLTWIDASGKHTIESSKVYCERKP